MDENKERLNADLVARFPALRRLISHKRRIPFIQQLTATDCGAASLAMVLAYYGRRVPLEQIRHVVGSDRDGTDLQALLRAAQHCALRARAVRLELDDLKQLPKASILHWEFSHFVILDEVTSGGVRLVDPAIGPRELSIEEFGKAFTGVALLLEPSEAFRAESSGKPRTTRRYAKHLFAQMPLLGRVLTLSVFLRVVALTLPILTGALIDRVIPRSDVDLFQLLMFGAVGIVVLHYVATLLRAHLSLYLRTQLEAGMTLNFIDHLAALPYDFFQNRTVGDLMVRMSSNTQVREILTTTALSSILDGALVFFYLLILFIGSPLLAAVALGLGICRVTLLLVIRRRQRELNSQSLDVLSRTQNYQVELLSGMETLKAMGSEARAVEQWSNLYVETLNVSLKTGSLMAWFNALSGAVSFAGPIIILSIGSLQVIDGTLSLGTMLALNALALGFLGPLDALVNTFAQFPLLTTYLERINDVLDTPREIEQRGDRLAPELTGGIKAVEVSFKYGPLAPQVVTDVSFEIESGAHVAIVGRSGAGKSTLGKVLIGLHAPTSGKVFYDGIALSEFAPLPLRQQLGVVTQRPYLFSGSIRDNIAMSNHALTLDQIVTACRIACIHDEITAMPMGYQTLVTSGGLSLSGGQRQRIALARALVHQPRILLLDEATSSLDALTERQVHVRLASLRCTRITIAHRLSTIREADSILVMQDGRIVERGCHQELVENGGVYLQLIRTQVDRPDS